MSVVTHPLTQKRFADAANRWNRLKREHAEACERMWLGTMLTNFDDDELAMLTDYLSQRDRHMLDKSGRSR